MQINRAEFDRCYNTTIIDKEFLEYSGYYEVERARYWETFRYLQAMNLPNSPEILDIGGGQLAILAHHLLNYRAVVGDVSDHYSQPVHDAGIPMRVCNLLADDPPDFKERFDVIALLEVIEHMPVPGYIILTKIAAWLKPGGAILITTPNLFRLRNLVRMIVGRDPFDRFMYAVEGQGLGHQIEYSADHLKWQVERAGLRIELLEHSQLGQSGHSTVARLARRLTAPLRMRKIWREELVAIVRRD